MSAHLVSPLMLCGVKRIVRTADEIGDHAVKRRDHGMKAHANGYVRCAAGLQRDLRIGNLLPDFIRHSIGLVAMRIRKKYGKLLPAPACDIIRGALERFGKHAGNSFQRDIALQVSVGVI